MLKKNTIKDVARLANTSPATVSLVLNKKNVVRKETRERVLNAVETLNYRPDPIARSLIKQKTGTVGFVVTDLKNPFFGTMAYNMQKQFDDLEQDLILGISNNKANHERKVIESMVKRGVDGILLVPSRDTNFDLQYLFDLRRMNIPLVFVSSCYSGITCDCVMTDFERAMFDLTNHLLESGARKIVFFCEQREIVYVNRRLVGYRRAFAEHQLAYDENWIVEAPEANTESGKRLTEQTILPMRPDAIIAINATSALGIMSCLKFHGIHVPGEISVVCFDELEYNDILYQPLTCASQDIALMCKESAAIMIQRLGGDKSPYRELLLPSNIVKRGSSK